MGLKRYPNTSDYFGRRIHSPTGWAVHDTDMAQWVVYTPTKPTLDDMRARVRGKQKSRTSLWIALDTYLRIEGDDVVMYWGANRGWYVNSTTGRWTRDVAALAPLVRYTKDWLEISPPAFGSNRGGLMNRIAPVLAEYGLFTYPLYRGVGNGSVGWSTTYPEEAYNFYTSGSREKTLATYIKVAHHYTPIPRGQVTRIGYNGEDLDNRGEGRKKSLKRSLAVSQNNIRRDTILKELGFWGLFTSTGYKIPPGVTVEDAKVMNGVAEGLGYRNVADAWNDGAPIFSNEMSEEMRIFIQEGLGSMYVDFLRQKK